MYLFGEYMYIPCRRLELAGRKAPLLHQVAVVASWVQQGPRPAPKALKGLL